MASGNVATSAIANPAFVGAKLVFALCALAGKCGRTRGSPLQIENGSGSAVVASTGGLWPQYPLSPVSLTVSLTEEGASNMYIRIAVPVFLIAIAFAPLFVRAQEPEPVQLFNGKDMTGWTFFLKDEKAKMQDVWSVGDGVIHCKGNPVGYIRTKEKYTSYKLKVEWRFPGKAGNSGVLLRVQEPDKVWPKSIESQLNSGDAGDIWNIDKFAMKTDPARTKDRRTI